MGDGRQMVKNEGKRVCIIGLGTIGFPTALHISKYRKVRDMT